MLGLSTWSFLYSLFCFEFIIPIQYVTAQNGSWPAQTFKTVPFHPPVFEITRYGPTAPGYLLFAPDALSTQIAPLIMTDSGDLIWQGAKTHAFAFSKQTFQGQPVLTYWNGTIFPEPIGRGSGTVHILNNAYEEIASVSLAGDFLTLNGTTYPSNVDLHEIYITESNTMLVTANNVTQADLRSVGGPESGWVVACLVYEIDIATNEVLFEWSSLDHLDTIPFSSSLYPLDTEGFNGTKQSSAWGYFHINSVAPLSNGGYLISSRYLCSAIAIDNKGTVNWVLQGRSPASIASGTSFCYQHDIRPHPPNDAVLSIFDTANAPLDNGTTPSNGLLLFIDLESKSTTLIHRYQNPHNPIFATAQGSMQLLPSTSGAFLGYGFFPVMEEYNAEAEIMLSIKFGKGPASLSYRAFREQWVGCPNTKPDVLALANGGGVEVYMSWNGATEVTEWDIYAGSTSDPKQMKLIMQVAKSGFETNTTIPTREGVGYIRAQAIERQGQGGGWMDWNGGQGCEDGGGNRGWSDVVSVN